MNLFAKASQVFWPAMPALDQSPEKSAPHLRKAAREMLYWVLNVGGFFALCWFGFKLGQWLYAVRASYTDLAQVVLDYLMVMAMVTHEHGVFYFISAIAFVLTLVAYIRIGIAMLMVLQSDRVYQSRDEKVLLKQELINIRDSDNGILRVYWGVSAVFIVLSLSSWIPSSELPSWLPCLYALLAMGAPLFAMFVGTRCLPRECLDFESPTHWPILGLYEHLVRTRGLDELEEVSAT